MQDRNLCSQGNFNDFSIYFRYHSWRFSHLRSLCVFWFLCSFLTLRSQEDLKHCIRLDNYFRHWVTGVGDG